MSKCNGCRHLKKSSFFNESKKETETINECATLRNIKEVNRLPNITECSHFLGEAEEFLFS